MNMNQTYKPLAFSSVTVVCFQTTECTGMAREVNGDMRRFSFTNRQTQLVDEFRNRPDISRGDLAAGPLGLSQIVTAMRRERQLETAPMARFEFILNMRR